MYNLCYKVFENKNVELIVTINLVIIIYYVYHLLEEKT